MSEIRADAIKNSAGTGAPDIAYTNTASGLSSATMQGALDEIVTGGGKLGKPLFPSGSILQVAEFTSAQTEVTIYTNVWTDSNLSGTIIPSNTNSKILVLVNQPVGHGRSGTSAWAGMRIIRNGTAITLSTTWELGIEVGGSGATNVSLWNVWSMSVFDSPNTTSLVTYKTQGRQHDATGGYIQFYYGGDEVYEAPGKMVLMEIAG